MMEPTSNGWPTDGRRRVVIEHVSPEVDCGRFAAKRIVGDLVVVEADIFVDGHESLTAVLRHRNVKDAAWTETPMQPLTNDRWRGAFQVPGLGRYVFNLAAWVDHFGTWREAMAKRVDAGAEISVELLVGAQLIEDAAGRASASEADWLRAQAESLWTAVRSDDLETGARLALSDPLLLTMDRFPDRSLATTYERNLPVEVDRERALYGAWYELFPRSCSRAPGQHGSFREVEDWLPRIADMGFDVLYLPPVSPIGVRFRKGRNNAQVAGEGDPGSPWAIGSAEGGHTAIHASLGTLDDFRHLVAAASARNIEVAIDIAFQCSADHPWVTEHPEWFRRRPDGTIQYAENPPKKYQDIYPLNFETDEWQALWEALRGVFLFWADQGVRIFRVDNPHTKPFPFWEWVIEEVKRIHPDAIFLAEAFTRPKVMNELAKLGFSQSYTYFTWRNTKQELIQYFTELGSAPIRDFFRPNLWPNTPDILPEALQIGGRPAFITRLVLAATLGASYGIYGPAFEALEGTPREPGSEEYLDSEKYEIRQWKLDGPEGLREVISRVNGFRRRHPALHRNDNVRFHPTDNDQLIAFSKREGDGTDVVLIVANLDPFHTQVGQVTLELDELGLPADETFQVHDELTDHRYVWRGAVNLVELDPALSPVHLFAVHRRTRSERDFEYFL
jgi:starch synthase (maltosyl-transferring)